jgi:hypothetical protein
MISDVFVVGAWDGTHLWLQWQAQVALDFEVQFALRKPGASEWEEWLTAFRVRQMFSSFTPQRAVGTEAIARVRHVGEEQWTEAVEATFAKSRCLFEFSSKYKTMHYIAGSEFHRVVDGAACSYRLLREIEVFAGAKIQAEVEAIAASGWSQLDRPGDFMIRPSYGVVIRNVVPSSNDVVATGLTHTTLQAKREGAITFAMQ